MRTYERSGITVDQCTECRGIWLDRGELERLTYAETSFHSSARALADVPPPAPPAYSWSGSDRDRGDESYRNGQYRENRYDDHYAPRRTKRKSFLEELFD